MYCNYCGQHNANEKSYCENCGKNIKMNTISVEKAGITEKKTGYCRKCGTPVLERYCTECGTVGYDIELKKEEKFKVPDININTGIIDDLKSKLQKSPLSNIKSVDDVKEIITSTPIFKISLISALKILGIGLVISFLLFTVITNIEPINEIFYSLDDAANYIDPQFSKLKPNFIDVFNLSLQSPMNVFLNLKREDYGDKIAIDSKITLSLKLLILLIIPVIAVIISQFKLFKNKQSSSENLLQYGLTSLIFTIIVKIIALINQKTIKISDPNEAFIFKLRFSINDLWSLLTIFMIIFSIHIIMSMIIKKDNPFAILNIKQYPDLGNRINTYIKSMAIYIGIASIAITIAMLISMVIHDSDNMLPYIIFAIIMGPALFVNMWLLSFGYNMDIAVSGYPSTTFNMKKVWDAIGELKDLYGSDIGTIWGYLFIFMLLIGLVYVIYRVVKDIEKEGYFVKLGFIAGAISIINVIFSYLGRVGITIKNTGANSSAYNLEDILYMLDLDFLTTLGNFGGLKQSYVIVSIIIVTFIWIFAIGSILYLLREKNIGQGVVSFLEKQKHKLILGYSLLLFASFYLVQSKLLEEMARYIFNAFPIIDMFM